MFLGSLACSFSGSPPSFWLAQSAKLEASNQSVMSARTITIKTANTTAATEVPIDRILDFHPDCGLCSPAAVLGLKPPNKVTAPETIPAKAAITPFRLDHDHVFDVCDARNAQQSAKE